VKQLAAGSSFPVLVLNLLMQNHAISGNISKLDEERAYWDIVASGSGFPIA
jgi:hypothetical protein